MKISREFIEKIPKTDLHLHLDGSLRLSTLIELARENEVELPAYDEAGLRAPGLQGRLRRPARVPARASPTRRPCCRLPAALERVGYELAQDNQAEGVRYIEVRFAPQLHQNAHMSSIEVMAALDRGLARAKSEFNAPAGGAGGRRAALRVRHHRLRHAHVRQGLLRRTSTRLLDVHAHSERKWVFALASLELVRAAVEARDQYGLPIVGFDLAGAEAGYPAERPRPGLRPGPQELPQEDRARRRGLRPGKHLPGHHRPARRPHRPRRLPLRRQT